MYIGSDMMSERGTHLLPTRTNGWRDIAFCQTREDVTLTFHEDQYQDTPERHRRVADGRPYCDAVTCNDSVPGDCPPEADQRPPPAADGASAWEKARLSPTPSFRPEGIVLDIDTLRRFIEQQKLIGTVYRAE